MGEQAREGVREGVRELAGRLGLLKPCPDHVQPCPDWCGKADGILPRVGEIVAALRERGIVEVVFRWVGDILYRSVGAVLLSFQVGGEAP